MFEGVIISIMENIFISFGGSLLKKTSLKLKKGKIKKELSKKVKDGLSKRQEDENYFKQLDVFLTKENFVHQLMFFCFDPGQFSFESINSYLKFLLEKFLEENPSFSSRKNCIYEDLYSLLKISLDAFNDYSNDETARLTIMNIREPLLEQLEIIRQQNQDIYQLINTSLVKQNNDSLDFDNVEVIKLYKSSLTPLYIEHNSYIPRNIYTEDDIMSFSIDCLLRDKHIILLGEPGSGKTYESINLLKTICTDKVYDEYIPIYIKLMEYGIVHDSILKFIKSRLYPYFGKITEEQLMSELAKKKFIIILDGVDEILDVKNRIKFFSEVNELLSDTDAYFYITSRINSYTGNIKNVVEYRIKGLAQEQIRKEFQKNGIGISITQEYYELFKNPLFLNIGIKVLKKSKTKFYNKSQLFNAYFEETCYKRDKNKQLPERVQKNYFEVLMLIGDLAFNTFDKSVLSISEFDEFYYFKKNKYTANNIYDVFRIDIFKIDTTISFSHRQFKEFFAAYFMVKTYDINDDREIYAELMQKENWQEVMIFASGLITDIDVQNNFLDMMLETNLKTYIHCVKFKNDLSAEYNELTYEEYSVKYLTTLYSSYMLIIETYFNDIYEKFAPFKSRREGINTGKKTCLVGSISSDRKLLHYWFDWKDSSEESVQLISPMDMADAYKDLQKRAFEERRNIVMSSVNLELSGLMGDSARQVANDVIYSSIKKMLEQQKLFESDYILYEKLFAQIKNIKILKDKSLKEIADWSNSYVEETFDFLMKL